MESFSYHAALLVVSTLQKLPLGALARFGRAAGSLAYLLDRRHRVLALKNLTYCFGGEKEPSEIRALARENFRRIGEAYATALKTSGMSAAEVGKHVEISGLERIEPPPPGQTLGNRILALGHFGNFELYTHLSFFLQPYKAVTTYRSLAHPALNKIVKSLRNRSGCEFFERRSEVDQIKTALRRRGTILGLLADQHARGGVQAPFFGRPCATTAAPALFALRYDCSVNTAICYRVAPGRWRIEINESIPIRQNGGRRSKEEITQAINLDFEKAIRRDPANWFWVHDRWRLHKPPNALLRLLRRREKLKRKREDSLRRLARTRRR